MYAENLKTNSYAGQNNVEMLKDQEIERKDETKNTKCNEKPKDTKTI